MELLNRLGLSDRLQALEIHSQLCNLDCSTVHKISGCLNVCLPTAITISDQAANPAPVPSSGTPRGLEDIDPTVDSSNSQTSALESPNTDIEESLEVLYQSDPKRSYPIPPWKSNSSLRIQCLRYAWHNSMFNCSCVLTA